MDVDVEIDENGEETEVDDGETLLSELQRLFGRMILTTRVDSSSGRVKVNGEGWRIEITADEEEIAFLPAGGTLRLVRRIDDVTSVEAGDDKVVFRFGDAEEITVARGIEQRLTHD